MALRLTGGPCLLISIIASYPRLHVKFGPIVVIYNEGYVIHMNKHKNLHLPFLRYSRKKKKKRAPCSKHRWLKTTDFFGTHRRLPGPRDAHRNPTTFLPQWGRANVHSSRKWCSACEDAFENGVHPSQSAKNDENRVYWWNSRLGTNVYMNVAFHSISLVDQKKSVLTK